MASKLLNRCRCDKLIRPIRSIYIRQSATQFNMLPRSPSPLNSRAARRLRVAIVAARYNPALADQLLEHARRGLAEGGVRQVFVQRVPGSYEIPGVAMRLARSKKFDAVIGLGVVLQGKTAHADHIALACAINLQQITLETGVPVIHQILTPSNTRDARARLALRGLEAARVAIEMAGLMRRQTG